MELQSLKANQERTRHAGKFSKSCWRYIYRTTRTSRYTRTIWRDWKRAKNEEK